MFWFIVLIVSIIIIISFKIISLQKYEWPFCMGSLTSIDPQRIRRPASERRRRRSRGAGRMRGGRRGSRGRWAWIEGGLLIRAGEGEGEGERGEGGCPQPFHPPTLCLSSFLCLTHPPICSNSLEPHLPNTL